MLAAPGFELEGLGDCFGSDLGMRNTQGYLERAPYMLHRHGKA